MPKPSNSTFLLVQRLRRVVEKHGYTANSLSVALGHAGLRNKLAASKYETLRLNDVVTILEFLGEPLDALLAPHLPASEPLRLLRRHRLALEPQSPDLRRWWQQRFELRQACAKFSMPDKVTEVNTLRRIAPHQALHYAQRWVDDVLAELAVKETDQRVLTYLSALISWASVSRSLGHTSDAAFAVELAGSQWGSSTPAGPVWATILFQTGFVLKDLSGIDGARDAIPLLEQGIGLAHLRDDRFELLMHYRGLGILARYAEHYDLAHEAARSALRHAQTDADRASLYQHLAQICCDQKRYRSAQHYLDLMPRTEALPPPEQFIVTWTRGKIYAGMGDFQPATQLLESLLETDHCDPVNHLLVFCELVQILLSQNKMTTLGRRAHRAALRALRNLDTTPATLRIVTRFLEQCSTGRITTREIEAAARGLRSSSC